MHNLCRDNDVIMNKNVISFMVFRNLLKLVFNDRVKAMPISRLECINAFLTSAFILQTYPVRHNEVFLFNYADSDEVFFFKPILQTIQICLIYLGQKVYFEKFMEIHLITNITCL